MQRSITNFDFKKEIKLSRFFFDDQLISNLSSDGNVYNWPIVYLISDVSAKEAYVGETTDTISRMSAHLKHDKKK